MSRKNDSGGRGLKKCCFFLTVAILFSIAVFADENKPHIVFLIGENEYGSHETMARIAYEIQERFDVKVTEIHSWVSGVEDPYVPDRVIPDTMAIPNLEAILDADLLVMYIRFRIPPAKQFDILQQYFDLGKPAVALRTTSHAFWHRKGWFPPFFGGHYKTHLGNAAGTTTMAMPDQLHHPILRGVKKSEFLGYGGVYNTQPLADSATPLMLGKTGDNPAEPIAWVNVYKPGSRIFYTSMGSREHFTKPSFRNLLYNAIFWSLGREIPPGGMLNYPDDEKVDFQPPPIPPPPQRAVPKDAVVLFDGKDLSKWRHWDPSVDPKAIGIDERAATTSGGPVYDAARWKVLEDGTTEARPGYGDILTRAEFGNYRLHLDFLIPVMPDYVKDNFRGASGVYVSGRYEVQLLDSYGKEPSKISCGAIYGVKAPDKNTSKKTGEWQSLDIEYRHREGSLPRISVWLNDELVQDNVELLNRTLYGFLAPPGSGGGPLYMSSVEEGMSTYNLNNKNYSVAVRFRTTASGCLISNAPAQRDWGPYAKGLFVYGGTLVYVVGWEGGIAAEDVDVSDGEWHQAILSSENGVVRLYLDGELMGERENFGPTDIENHVFRIGDSTPTRGAMFAGQIGEVRFYPQPLSPDALKNPPVTPALHWQPKKAGSTDAPIVKGPIRLQADTSRLRFANIWLQPLK